MASRLYPAGHLNDTGAIETCFCGWRGPLKTLAHCDRPGCYKHHPPDRIHEGQCAKPGCEADAVNYAKPGRKPRYGYHCLAHAVEGPDDLIGPRVTGGAMAHIIGDDDRAAMKEASKELAALMPKAEPLPHLDDEGADFVAWSNSEKRFKWPMVFTPEGYAVHVGEGCIGEAVRGACHHSKENHD